MSNLNNPITVDIDGTLGDFVKAFGQWSIKKYHLPNNFKFTTPNYSMWKGGNWPQKTDNQFLRDLKESGVAGLYRHLEPLDNAIENVKQLADCYPLVICTSRPPEKHLLKNLGMRRR